MKTKEIYLRLILRRLLAETVINGAVVYERILKPPPLRLLLLISSLLLQGCSTPDRGNAVPRESQKMASIRGMPGIRYWGNGDEGIAGITRDGLESLQRERAFLAKTGHAGSLPPADFLAISGGGDNGAFGTGVLVGWTKAGNRPQFKVITGISTGALIAPFAFLGSAYDDRLRQLYTGISPNDIRKRRNKFSILFKDALTDNGPLLSLLQKNITKEMLTAIAVEHEKGRILLIGTTDLDAQRPVIWNITKIAASQDPKALELVHHILLASTAIPGVFPPTFVDVELDGKPYQEMHVDGGATAQVFVYPPSFELDKLARERGIARERKLYVLRNARLDPDWAQVNPRTLTIMGRAIASLIQNQGIGDLFNMYLTTKRDKVDYNLASIPKTFDAPHKEEFDTEYMRSLYNVGYAMGAAGYPWAKVPPGYIEEKTDLGTQPSTRKE